MKVESEVALVSISVCLNYNERKKDTSFLIEVFMRFKSLKHGASILLSRSVATFKEEVTERPCCYLK